MSYTGNLTRADEQELDVAHPDYVPLAERRDRGLAAARAAQADDAPVTDNRAKFVRDLLDEREVPAEAVARLLARLAIKAVTNGEARGYIEWLKKRSRKATATPRHESSAEAAPVGVYELDGELYAVREAKGDDGQPFRFARRLVVTNDADGGVHRVDFEKAPGVQYRVHNGRRLTVDEVEALSLDFKRCALCGRPLKVKESKQAGIGPRCRERIG